MKSIVILTSGLLIALNPSAQAAGAIKKSRTYINGTKIGSKKRGFKRNNRTFPRHENADPYFPPASNFPRPVYYPGDPVYPFPHNGVICPIGANC